MTSYPNDIDTDAQLPRVDDNISEIGAEALNAMRSAIIAIQRTIGQNPQGTTASLVTRISSAINDDGTLKASALLAAGLVALPITNAQISATAAIEEGKLDLDVATQSLQNQVSSNDIDIAALQKSIAEIIANFSLHVNGLAFKHDSFDILLDSASPSATPAAFSGLTSTDVGNALIEMNARFIDHSSSSKVGAHKAENISVDSSGFIAIPNTVADVQTAIEELDKVRDMQLVRHRDHMHANGFDNWSNNVEGYDVKNQIVPSVFGNTSSAQTFASLPNKLRFTGVVLGNAGVSQGDTVVISGGDAAGVYIIDDVGPRPSGVRPLLTSEELELTAPLANISLVAPGTVEAQIFGSSSVFTFKANVAPTLFQNATMDSVQVARPNSAKVLSLGIKPSLVDGTETLDITVGLDSGTRSVSISGLNQDRLGVVTDVTTETIVDRINSILHGSINFPLSAYTVGDELMLSHNWDGYAGYFVRIDSSGSGYNILGLDGYGADAIDHEFRPTQSSSFYANGYRHTSLDLIYTGSASAASSSISFSGFNPIDAGVKIGHILHVKNHSTQDDNGTYYITGVSSNSVSIHTSIGTSVVDVEIAHDAVPLASLAGSGRTHLIETFIDRDAKLAFNVRLEYDNSITNLDVISVSDNAIPAEYSLTSEVVSGGHNVYVESGKETFIPSGFLGKKEIFLPSNIEFITVDVIGPLGSSPFGGAELIVNKHVNEEEVLEIASVRSDGSSDLYDLVDKRLFGTIGIDEVREDVVQAYVESPVAELRSDGVVRGFELYPGGGPFDGYYLDFVYPNNGALLLRGGTAYVDGVRSDVRTQSVIFPVPSSATTFVVCLNQLGNYKLVDIADFSLQQILAGEAGKLLPIVQVDHDGSSSSYPLSSPVDLRRFINAIDDKLDLIVDSSNHMIGTFASAEAAIAYANAYPQDEKFTLRIVSRDSNHDITVPVGSRDLSIEIDGYIGTLNINAPVKVSSRGIYGRVEAHVTGNISVSSSCSSFVLSGLHIGGTISLAGASSTIGSIRDSALNNTVTITEGASYDFTNCVFESGNGVSDSSSSYLDFSRTTFNSGGINKANASSVTKASSCLFSAPSNNPIVTTGHLLLSDSSFKSCLSVNASNGSIVNCEFDNAPGISIESTGSISISDCVFNATTDLIIDAPGSLVTSCYFNNTTSNSNIPIVKSKMFSQCVVDSNTLGGISGNFIVQAEVVEDGYHISQVYGLFEPGPHRIEGNTFLPADNLGQQIVLGDAESTSDLRVISSNKFILGASQDGILLGNDLPGTTSKNILIQSNLFVPNTGKTPSSAINLFETGSLGNKNIKIFDNVFEGVPGLSNTEAASSLSLCDNVFSGTGSIFTVSIADECHIVNNRFVDSSYANFQGAISNLEFSSNHIDGYGVTIGSSSVSGSIITRNTGTIYLEGNVSRSTISENIGAISAPSVYQFSEVIMTNNHLDVDSTFQNAVWSDSIISENLFKNTSGGVTIYVADGGANVGVLGNVFNLLSDLTFNAATSISNILVSGNFSLANSTMIFSRQLANSFALNNFNFDIEINSASTSSINANLMPSKTITLNSTLSGVDVSGNTVNNIDVVSASAVNVSIQNNNIFNNVNLDCSSTGGLVVSNNSITSNLNIIGASGDYSIHDAKLSGNKVSGDISVFRSILSAETQSLNGVEISSNNVGGDLIFNIVNGATVSIASCTINANTISGDMLLGTGGVSSSTFTFSNNVVDGNYQETGQIILASFNSTLSTPTIIVEKNNIVGNTTNAITWLGYFTSKNALSSVSLNKLSNNTIQTFLKSKNTIISDDRLSVTGCYIGQGIDLESPFDNLTINDNIVDGYITLENHVGKDTEGLNIESNLVRGPFSMDVGGSGSTYTISYIKISGNNFEENDILIDHTEGPFPANYDRVEVSGNIFRSFTISESVPPSGNTNSSYSGILILNNVIVGATGGAPNIPGIYITHETLSAGFSGTRNVDIDRLNISGNVAAIGGFSGSPTKGLLKIENLGSSGTMLMDDSNISSNKIMTITTAGAVSMISGTIDNNVNCEISSAASHSSFSVSGNKLTSASFASFVGVISDNSIIDLSITGNMTGVISNNYTNDINLNTSSGSFAGVMSGNYASDITINSSVEIYGSVSSNYCSSLTFNEVGFVGTGAKQLKVIGNTASGKIDTMAVYSTDAASEVFFWGNTADVAPTNLTISGTTATNTATANSLGGIIDN